MASPQTENGYIKIASEISFALSRAKITEREYRFLWVLWYKTYGWGKKKEKIANNYFSKITGLDRRHILKIKNQLISKNVISVDDEGIGFNKNWEKWSVISTDDKCHLYGCQSVISTDAHKSNKQLIKEMRTKVRTSKSMRNYLQSDFVDEVVDLEGKSLNEKPEDQNKEWWKFLVYWKGRVKELYGLDYKVVGGDKAAFHRIFKKVKYNHKTMTHIIEFYLTGEKAEQADIQTIRAALSAHSLMLFEKNRYKL